MAKDGTQRGGARVGAGRKRKPLTDKISEGRTATIIDLPAPADMVGVETPPVKEYMTARQKDGKDMCAADVFKTTWAWLKERKCDALISPQLVEQYAMAVGRWVQCEEALSEYVANGMQLMNDGALDGSQIEQYTQVVSDLTTVLGNQAGEAAASAGTVGTTLSDGMADAMNTYDWNSTGSTVMSDIVSGFEAAGGDLTQVGDDVAAGIGQGEAAHDFSGDASTTIGNDETALRSAAASQSPAQRFVPLGDDIAAGIGQGMGQHDFSGEAQSVISAIQGAFTLDKFVETGSQAASGLAQGMTGTDMGNAGATVSANVQRSVNGNLTISTLRPTGTTAVSGLAAGMNGYSFASAGSSVVSRVKASVSSSLTSSTLSSVGQNAMAGLAAGIRSGTASVVSAMRSAAQSAVAAAKSALDIKSPSRVFRDEVGVMVMKGFGEGIQDEAREQARIIGNAARYLTNVAQGGVATGSADNRRTYNNTSTVNLHVANMNVRDKQDIRSLAIEIAGLTKTQQRGRGLRMA